MKKILDRDQEDPVKRIYNEMLKYPSENNWANNVLDLRCKYNLLQNHDNIADMTWSVWKKMVKNMIKRFAFMTLETGRGILGQDTMTSYPRDKTSFPKIKTGQNIISQNYVFQNQGPKHHFTQ